MKKVKQNSYQIEKNNLDVIQKDFLSESCNEQETLDIIKKNNEENNIILDPHTAVGVGAAKKLSFNDCVVLSTAHPCKFPDAINNAISKHQKLPEELHHVLDKKEIFQVLKNDTEDVKNFVKSKELWEELDFLTNEFEISWNWVKAHSTDELNNEVDLIAKEAANL